MSTELPTAATTPGLLCQDCPRVFAELEKLIEHESAYGHGTWAEEWHGWRTANGQGGDL